MTARQQPPVPPLGEAAVSRIERGVFAALDREAAERAAGWWQASRPRWRGRALAVAASALAALALLAGRHFWRAPGLPGHGARIATATSPSHVTVEGAAIDVAPSSAITFAPSGDAAGDGATVIRLERGTVTCEVAPRGARAPFVVEAGTTRVTVVGTRFGVTRIGDRAEVWVTHGTVEVGDDGMTQLVHAGERYVPGAPADSVAREVVPERASAVPTPGAATEVGPALGGEPTQQAAERSGPAPVGAVVRPVAEQSGPSHEPARRVAESGPLSQRDSRTLRPRERVRERADLASGVARPAISPANSVEETAQPREPPPVVPPRAPEVTAAALTSAMLRERFQSAVALEVRDPLAAARIYRDLASGSGPWAVNALFAEARLSAERGQLDAAQALLSTYLERFPGGPNADDARALLGRLKGGAGGGLR